MKPFRSHTGILAPLNQPNVDTDQIIPKQFLKRIERTGFGQFLFYDWRYTADSQPNESFILNDPRFRNATILAAGRNFGCGSSREHAPWALLDYGFRAIIAPTFADIFATNCTKNGILPVVLAESEVTELIRRAGETPDYQVIVDLEQQAVYDQLGFSARFAIDDFRRHCLLEGLDDIGLTVQHEAAIQVYEANRPAWRQQQQQHLD